MNTPATETVLVNGFAPAPKLHPIGIQLEKRDTRVLRSRQQWDQLPVLDAAVSELIAHVQDENRHDETVPLNALTMDEQGYLVLDGDRIGAEKHGFRQLCQRARIPGGSAYLAACPPELRARNLNHWLDRTGSDDRVKLRLRRTSETYSLFASVSPSYAVYDVPEMLAEVLTMLPSDARVEASYDGLHLRFRAVFADEKPVNDMGEVFRFGVEITSADDGTGALWIAAVVWRVLCTNLMLFSVERQAKVKRIHKGRSSDMVAALFLGIRACKQIDEDFGQVWSQAKQEQLSPNKHDRRKLLETLFDHKVLQTPGIRATESIGAILTAWDREPGLTRADLVNAVTRSAHEFPWPNVAVAEGLEAQAGRLLTVQLQS